MSNYLLMLQHEIPKPSEGLMAYFTDAADEYEYGYDYDYHEE